MPNIDLWSCTLGPQINSLGHHAVDMPRWIYSGIRHTYLLRKITFRFLILITCVSLLVSVLWTQFPDRGIWASYSYNETLTEEVIQTVSQDLRYAEIYRKKSWLPSDLKYLLLWTPDTYAPFYYLGSGQRMFIRKNCSVINCYVTSDRKFFGGDLTKFDAVAFNGRNIQYAKPWELPKSRSSNQKYIFLNMESADNYPICSDALDGFFNWTSTYRLDSDIPYPYLLVRSSEGKIVGPKRNMEWLKEMGEVDEDLSYRLQNKSKVAAWFVSHCSSRSKRDKFVKRLQRALEAYNLQVDVYGSCGSLQCPRHRQKDCDDKLEKEYFFYMSMENSFADDYVTEKVLTAVQHDAVPIVYGGANYSRFLPPGSYLDARKQDPEVLAGLMHRLMQSPKLYSQFFRWKKHYTYHDPSAVENVCAICAALNNKTMLETPTFYEDFRSWWNPHYSEQCNKKSFWG